MLYGALLNKHFRFYDDRLGESTTGTGRAILKFQCSKVNELLTGVYDPLGDAVLYGDTDSHIGMTVINTDNGIETVETLFHNGTIIEDSQTNKQYSIIPDLHALSYDPQTKEAVYEPVRWIYRHKTAKPLFEVEDENGNVLTITGDHSLMVERNGQFMEVKPTDLNTDTDILITVKEVNGR